MMLSINEQILFDFYIQRAKDTRKFLMNETELEWACWFRTANGMPCGKHFRKKFRKSKSKKRELK